MADPLLKPWTVEDFLEWEAQQEDRYEFIDGRILGMVGGTVAHALIKGNVYAALRSRLHGQACRPVIDGPKVVTGKARITPTSSSPANRFRRATTASVRPS